ncbi:UNVERIFIED_CONTAM: hypothetical protein Slati_0103900 [Sesamum latifolium]|uniref:Uncharacterized protein n=1 Tax=Sesamum latifolium TaxID=2727402 RepID=A0AAW2Y8M3_9LAMI
MQISTRIPRHRDITSLLLNGVPGLATSEMMAAPPVKIKKTLRVMLFNYELKKTNKLRQKAKKLFVQYEEVEKRSTVYTAVGSIPGIDLNDQILISDCLVENPKKMDLFFSLPDDARARMVGLMLRVMMTVLM